MTGNLAITPWNPCAKAIARVKNPLPKPDICPFCSGSVHAVKNSAIYGKTYGDWPYAYLCTICRAYIGMHPSTDIPLGTLADKPLREARKDAKPVFNAIWQGRHMRRGDAYKWLAGEMGIPHGECHFGWFTAAQCRKAALVCESYLDKKGAPHAH